MKLITILLTATFAIGTFVVGTLHVTQDASARNDNPDPGPPSAEKCTVCTVRPGGGATCDSWNWYGYKHCIPILCDGCNSEGEGCTCTGCYTWGHCTGPTPIFR
jgi:hypothetical protein